MSDQDEEEIDQYGRSIFKAPVKVQAKKPPTGPKFVPVNERKSLAPVDRDFKPESMIGKTIELSLGDKPGATPNQAQSSDQRSTHFYCDKC